MPFTRVEATYESLVCVIAKLYTKGTLPWTGVSPKQAAAYQLRELVVSLESAQHAAELMVVAVLSQAFLLLQNVSGACY